jgi:hypothetical protein
MCILITAVSIKGHISEAVMKDVTNDQTGAFPKTRKFSPARKNGAVSGVVQK